MANTVTLDIESVSHQLPEYYAGLGAAAYFASTDFPTAGYRASLENINPEVLRWSPWNQIGVVGNLNADTNAMRNLGIWATARGMAISMISGFARPKGPLPMAATTTNDPTNYANVTGKGDAPSEQAAMYVDWVKNAGIRAPWYEPFNEPTNSIWGNGGGPYFSGDTTGKVHESWTYQIIRVYRQAVLDACAAAGIAAPRIHSGSLATEQPYGYALAKACMKGTDPATGKLPDGRTWPWPDENWDYWDSYVFHNYGGGENPSSESDPGPGNGTENIQAYMNSVLWTPASTQTPNDNVGLRAMLNMCRNFADAAGHPEKMLVWNEGGKDDITAGHALYDVLSAILAANSQNIFKIDYWTHWSYNVSIPSHMGIWSLMDRDQNYLINPRGRILRDLVFYYSRNYKRQLISGTNGVVSTDKTPNAGGIRWYDGTVYMWENSVDAIQVCAGLNAAGDKVAVVVANADLSAAHTVTVTLNNCTVTGQATGRFATRTESGTGTTPLPAITPISLSNGSFSKSIEAGAAYIFEIPIVATSGGGNGGGGNGGGESAFPSTSVLDDFNRADGALGANWPGDIKDTHVLPVIASNQMVPVGTTGYAQAYWADVFDADQEVFVKLAARAGSTKDMSLALRLTNPGASPTCYFVGIANLSAASNIELYVFVNGTPGAPAVIASNVSWADGDIFGVRIVGSTITVYKNGEVLNSIEDATISGDGYIGIEIGNSAGVALEDFGGGDYVPSSGGTHPTTGTLGSVGNLSTGFGGIPLGTVDDDDIYTGSTRIGAVRSTATYPPA
jgi:hypothetical protein